MLVSHSLTKTDFDSLLCWLDSEDRERAGEKYEAIRRNLIEIFRNRGLSDPEGSADETINRVARKVEDLAGKYEGDPTLYFYGVARRMILEDIRARTKSASLAKAMYVSDETARADLAESSRVELYFEALERSLNKLTEADRTLILEYYGERKQAKINNRRALSSQLSVAPSALRARTYRVRLKLEKYVREELARLGED